MNVSFAPPGEASSDVSNACRVCGALTTRSLGKVEYILGYSREVHECDACGCRYTSHDAHVHEQLHQTGALGYYDDYRNIARQCHELFNRGDVDGLRRALRAVPKYRFVIDQVSKAAPDARLLEIGASRGYLTSYFILDKRAIRGVDSSREAVESARNLFGNHFYLAEDAAVKQGAPYDIIYHVGTIGCVSDPVGMTRDLISMLRPGGQLFFNAPNRDALYLRGQLWFDSAPPPDLVTLFPPGFWTKQFPELVDVTENADTMAPDQALTIFLRRLCGMRWKKPEPKQMGRASDGAGWPQQGGRAWAVFERLALGLSRKLALTSLAPQRPAEFGLFVTMRRK